MKFKAIPTHFNKSGKASGDLEAVQAELGCRPLRTESPGKTRWNGTHASMQRSNVLEHALRRVAEGKVPKRKYERSSLMCIDSDDEVDEMQRKEMIAATRRERAIAAGDNGLCSEHESDSCPE